MNLKELESIDRQIAAREIDLRELRMRRRRLIGQIAKNNVIGPKLRAIETGMKKTREALEI